MAKLILFAVVIAVGQLLFKRVSMGLNGVHGAEAILTKLATDPLFLLALALYGSATILWVLALREVPLSLAYPFTALAFVLVPLGAAVIFKEPVGARYFVGLVFVVGGICIVGSGVNA